MRRRGYPPAIFLVDSLPRKKRFYIHIIMLVIAVLQIDLYGLSQNRSIRLAVQISAWEIVDFSLRVGVTGLDHTGMTPQTVDGADLLQFGNRCPYVATLGDQKIGPMLFKRGAGQ